jgi:hypothetical protein
MRPVGRVGQAAVLSPPTYPELWNRAWIYQRWVVDRRLVGEIAEELASDRSSTAIIATVSNTAGPDGLHAQPVSSRNARSRFTPSSVDIGSPGISDANSVRWRRDGPAAAQVVPRRLVRGKAIKVTAAGEPNPGFDVLDAAPHTGRDPEGQLYDQQTPPAAIGAAFAAAGVLAAVPAAQHQRTAT